MKAIRQRMKAMDDSSISSSTLSQVSSVDDNLYATELLCHRLTALQRNLQKGGKRSIRTCPELALTNTLAQDPLISEEDIESDAGSAPARIEVPTRHPRQADLGVSSMVPFHSTTSEPFAMLNIAPVSAGYGTPVSAGYSTSGGTPSGSSGSEHQPPGPGFKRLQASVHHSFHRNYRQHAVDRVLCDMKQEMRQDVKNVRLSTALSAVKSLPENVGDVLRHSANSLADDLHGVIGNLNTAQAGNLNHPQAVAELESIPGMILNTFEASVNRAQELVRVHVECIMKDLQTRSLASEEIAQQLWTIPEEVQSIASEAVIEAVLESKDQASQKLNDAQQVPPVRHAKTKIPNELENVQWQVDAATAMAVTTVEQAVSVVQGAAESGCMVPNNWIASALLRVKTAAAAGQTPGAPDASSSSAEQPHTTQLSQSCFSVPGAKELDMDKPTAELDIEKVTLEGGTEVAHSASQLAAPAVLKPVQTGGHQQQMMIPACKQQTMKATVSAPAVKLKKQISPPSSDDGSVSGEREEEAEVELEETLDPVADGAANCVTAPDPGLKAASSSESSPSRSAVTAADYVIVPPPANSLQVANCSTLGPPGSAAGGAGPVIVPAALQAPSSIEAGPSGSVTGAAAACVVVPAPGSQGASSTGFGQNMSTVLPFMTNVTGVQEPSQSGAARAIADVMAFQVTQRLEELSHSSPAALLLGYNAMSSQEPSFSIPASVSSGYPMGAEPTNELRDPRFAADRLELGPSTVSDVHLPASINTLHQLEEARLARPAAVPSVADIVHMQPQNELGTSVDVSGVMATDVNDWQRLQEPGPNAISGVASTGPPGNFLSQRPQYPLGALSQEEESNSWASRGVNGCQYMNRGSLGHPELCARPCLYFHKSGCAHGMNCDFCHFQHPRRPAHLDKKHRDMLKRMSLADCLLVILPILQEKLQDLDIDPQAIRLVELFEQQLLQNGVRPPKSTRPLVKALEAFSIRSLMSTLRRMVPSEATPESIFMEELMVYFQKYLQRSDDNDGSVPTFFRD